MNVETILFDSGLYYHIFTYLHWWELLIGELVNKQFFTTIRLSEPLWRFVLSKYFQTKYYIHPVVKRFLTNGNTITLRNDLLSMSIKELKYLAYSYGVNITTCFEKTDLVHLINKRELREKLPTECLGHYSIRISWLDRKRNCITEDDLCNYEWNIRVRGDGPLKSLVVQDTWWNTPPPHHHDDLVDGLLLSDLDDLSSNGEMINTSKPTTTTLKFYKNGEFHILTNGPSFLDSMISSQTEAFTYSLEKSGTILSLSIGVKEYVARHPDNWGFVLQSQGTVWTNYPMPKKGHDLLLEDENVSSLITKEINYGPLI